MAQIDLATARRFSLALGDMKRIIWIILLIPFIAHAESIKLVLIQSLGDSFVDYSHTEVHFFAGPQKADVYKIRDKWHLTIL